ncbi:hypothetical protein RCCS2_06979 [Roseobacter sp. CCS2]|nr:hypothetical protein RCCS2_06979 [Roseobacter sp. CCS2]
MISDRSGVEIDYCPDCRGVWLDRGELDKIIERSMGAGGGDSRRPDRRDDRYEERPRKKRESFLGELFDF